MVGIPEISAAFASMKAAGDIIKGITSIRDANKLGEVRLELQSIILDAQEKLLSAQQGQSAQADRVADLEQQIMRLKDWESERERYELVAVASGAFAYMQKAGVRDSEPPHWLCANCFDQRKKSILQRVDVGNFRPATREWRCPTCKAAVSVGFQTLPAYSE